MDWFMPEPEPAPVSPPPQKRKDKELDLLRQQIMGDLTFTSPQGVLNFGKTVAEGDRRQVMAP